MHMLFLDESGSIDKNADKFILGGVVISEHTWHELYTCIHEIKKKYKIDDYEIKWRYFYAKARNSPLDHLNENEKNNLRDEIFAAIVSFKSIRTLGFHMNLSKVRDNQPNATHDEIYLYIYQMIVKQFQEFLSDMSAVNGIKINGIVICDHMGKSHNDNIKLHHNDQILKNMLNYPNVIECLFLVDSHLSLGVQLADMVVGAYYRKITKGDLTFFNKIKPIFERSLKWGITEIECLKAATD